MSHRIRKVPRTFTAVAMGMGDRNRRSLRTLTRMLRDRLDAIDGELTDARHFLDEVEIALGAPPPRRRTDRKRI